MATAREWAEGYRSQAAADLRAAHTLQGREPSVEAMLLQMILEKLGKAALLRSGQMNAQTARQKHTGASQMVRQLARDRRRCNQLGYKPSAVKSFDGLVTWLENSQPSRASNGPNLEYPWEAGGVIHWPAQHLGVTRSFLPKTNDGQRLYRFVEQLCDRFNQVFP